MIGDVSRDTNGRLWRQMNRCVDCSAFLPDDDNTGYGFCMCDMEPIGLRPEDYGCICVEVKE